MKREEKIIKLMDKANKLMKRYTVAGERKIWRECGDWNDKQTDESEEIFMCEVTDENNTLIGFAIEDGIWYYAYANGFER